MTPDNKSDSQSDNEISRTKIFTVILGRNEDIKVQVIEERFKDIDKEEMKGVLANLLRIGSMQSLEQYDQLDKLNSEEYNQTPINPGSYYDDIVFECGVYIDSDREVILNVSFGSLADSNFPLAESVKVVSDAMLFLAESIDPSVSEEELDDIAKNIVLNDCSS